MISPNIAASVAYWKAKEFGWSQELEDAVINSGELYYIYNFARAVGGANIPRLQQAVIDSGKPSWAHHFARDVRGSNIPKLEQIVIDSGNMGWAQQFARDIPNANISDLIDFVLINEPERIKELFKEKPSLRRKYELGEIRRQIRGILR